MRLRATTTATDSGTAGNGGSGSTRSVQGGALPIGHDVGIGSLLEDYALTLVVGPNLSPRRIDSFTHGAIASSSATSASSRSANSSNKSGGRKLIGGSGSGVTGESPNRTVRIE